MFYTGAEWGIRNLAADGRDEGLACLRMAGLERVVRSHGKAPGRLRRDGRLSAICGVLFGA